MIKNIFVALITLFFAISAKAQDTTAILAKASVLPASEKDAQAAVAATEKVIKDVNEAASLFETFMIIGPRLWEKMKDEADFKSIEEGNVTFKVPKFNADGGWSSKEDAKGKALQSTVHYLKLWTFIRQNFDLSNMQIAEINNRDKFIFWLYFAKIEEPIVTMQNDKTRLMIKYVKGKVFFIEITGE